MTAAQTLVDISDVLIVAGDRAAAEAALTEAIALNEEKGNTVSAQQCRERLAPPRVAARNRCGLSGYPRRKPCFSANVGIVSKSISSSYRLTTSPIAASSRSTAASNGASSRK